MAKKDCIRWFNSLDSNSRLDVLHYIPYDDWDSWGTPQQEAHHNYSQFTPSIQNSICRIYERRKKGKKIKPTVDTKYYRTPQPKVK